MTPTARLTVTKDTVSEVVRSITELARKQVLVGIPESTTSREEELEKDITNAALGFIHENGSPARNIPARPFLVPGTEKVLPAALDRLKGAAQATVRGDTHKADQLLNDAGIIAMGGARSEIRYGDFEPLSPKTVANRYRQRGAKSRRENEEVYLYLVRMGVHPAAAQGEAGIRPLINTAQLANAITYVVREK